MAVAVTTPLILTVGFIFAPVELDSIHYEFLHRGRRINSQQFIIFPTYMYKDLPVHLQLVYIYLRIAFKC